MKMTISREVFKNKTMAGIKQKNNPGLAPYYGFQKKNYLGSYNRAKHTNIPIIFKIN